jgi:arylsulfatase A-like enzyme
MQFSRRSFLAAAAGAGLMAQSGRRPPNIVLILADDLGWADTSVYGGDLVETPHLEKLAAGGVRFTEAYAAAPICSPTRASIMTGKWPARLHMTIWYEGGAAEPPRDRKLIPPRVKPDLALSEVTLAEVLRSRGYMNGHVGKWHLGSAGYYPEAHGFDLNIGGTFWGAPQTFFHPYTGSKRFRGEFRYVPGLPWGKEGEYLTDRLTDEALRFMERAADRPFFLNLWHHAPHTPIEAKPELVKHYEKKLKPGMHHQNAVTAAMVHSLDESVGRVMAKLDELKLAENTVVLFTSDNGGYIGRFEGKQVTSNHPLRSGKGSLYEGGIRVPLIVRGGGAKPGATCAEPVISTDLFATLADLAGASGVAPQDGMTLSGLLRDPAAKLAREDLYFHYPHYYETTSPVSAVRSRDWKLLEYFEDNRIELYNLREDPGEARNVAAVHAAKAEELRQKLHAWRGSVAAQVPTANPKTG